MSSTTTTGSSKSNKQEVNDSNRQTSLENNITSSSSPRSYIRSACETFVHMTNDTLAMTQHKIEHIQNLVSSRLRPLGRQVTLGTQRIIDFYINDRITYGPQIITCTATTFGGLTLLRRGRILPGAAVAVLAGTSAYAAVYGLQMYPIQTSNKEQIIDKSLVTTKKET